jgi:hypothetical protein
MNTYQNNVLFLSHEETDMARFLKEYAQVDKTRAGKMMASISKVLAYTAHQRLGLRQPLLRLHNEIETFRHRAITDTLSTVKRMETARTEYRGSILWLKDASIQLDPEKQLEKFRRVQSQVKTTKTEYDRLKSDVIQKIDLLTASRWLINNFFLKQLLNLFLLFFSSNMYSHALATYQKSLIVFWEKTSKTMSAVAESFKGYQYYEFTVIKDLAEPSRLLAEMNSKSLSNDKTKEKDNSLIDVNETKQINDSIEPVNALIDISDDQLNDQLLELEKLTTIDRTLSASGNTKTDNLVDISDTTAEHEKLFSDLLSPLSSGNTTTDLLGTNENTSFDAHWTAAFGNTSNQQQQTSGIQTDPTTSNNNFLPSSFLSELLTSMNKNKQSTVQSASNNPKPKPITTTKPSDKSNWLNLFAELDPIQNPDAIGKPIGDETDRNC